MESKARNDWQRISLRLFKDKPSFREFAKELKASEQLVELFEALIRYEAINRVDMFESSDSQIDNSTYCRNTLIQLNHETSLSEWATFTDQILVLAAIFEHNKTRPPITYYLSHTRTNDTIAILKELCSVHKVSDNFFKSEDKDFLYFASAILGKKVAAYQFFWRPIIHQKYSEVLRYMNLTDIWRSVEGHPLDSRLFSLNGIALWNAFYAENDQDKLSLCRQLFKDAVSIIPSHIHKKLIDDNPSWKELLKESDSNTQIKVLL